MPCWPTNGGIRPELQDQAADAQPKAQQQGGGWARLMYDVSSAFDSEPWLKWALPLMVLGGLLILVLLLFGLWRCWKGGAKPVGKGGSKLSSARVTPA